MTTELRNERTPMSSSAVFILNMSLNMACAFGLCEPCVLDRKNEVGHEIRTWIIDDHEPGLFVPLVIRTSRTIVIN